MGSEKKRLVAALLTAFSSATVFAEVDESAGMPASESSEAGATVLPEVSVTGTREAEAVVEIPMSVGIVKGNTIRADKPSHPAQIMSQVPGVAVAVTNGEGHTTSIRHPFSTNPVYLFLEDGIPVRSTGFYNHNALYEVNVPMAGGVEVVRGPGSALYGSDAIGGVVNALTQDPPLKPELVASGEIGGHGWRRLLVGGGNGYENDAWRADLNLTHTDGWRDETAYDRQAGNLRWDHTVGDTAMLKTTLAFSRVDQETGASSPLIESDYRNDPTRNYKPIAFRKVEALRLSTNYEREEDNTLLSITPYVRDDSMDLLASFTLNFDPTVYTTQNQSYGLMAKWRRDFPENQRARLIAGIDLDISPGGREEDKISVTTTGGGASTVFTSYTVGQRVYDYDVTFKGISPYVHGEISPTDRLRVTAGLRYDMLSFDFDNSVTVTSISAGGKFYGQAPDTEVDFSQLSPKLGLTYAFAPQTHGFIAYNHGFRAPSESNLFRPSAAASDPAAQAFVASSLQLKPIKADQVELGLRGSLRDLSYNIAVYNLIKRDDIVTFKEAVTNFTQTTNAGRTEHRGVEVGVGAPLSEQIRADVAASYAKHVFDEWVITGTSFNGKEMDSAPRLIANTRLTWTPKEAARVQLEWVRIDDYWLDANNTTRYPGHDLLNLRTNWPIAGAFSLFGRIDNLLDKRYADSAGFTSGVPVFSPGLPRTLYAGVEAKW